MNTKEMLEKAIKHVLKQGQQAVDGYGACKYRGDSGLMCAVGCLIKDEYYHKDLEGNAVYETDVMEALESSLERKLTDRENWYLQIIQQSHDDSNSSSFRSEFSDRIKKYVRYDELPTYCLDFIQEAQ